DTPSLTTSLRDGLKGERTRATPGVSETARSAPAGSCTLMRWSIPSSTRPPAAATRGRTAAPSAPGSGAVPAGAGHARPAGPRLELDHRGHGTLPRPAAGGPHARDTRTFGRERAHVQLVGQPALPLLPEGVTPGLGSPGDRQESRQRR